MAKKQTWNKQAQAAQCTKPRTTDCTRELTLQNKGPQPAAENATGVLQLRKESCKAPRRKLTSSSCNTEIVKRLGYCTCFSSTS